jgi:hypothetical protein
LIFLSQRRGLEQPLRLLDEPTLYGPVWGAAASREATGISWMPVEHAMIKPHIDAPRPAGGGNLAEAVEEGVIPECQEEAQPLVEHAVGRSPLFRQTVCLPTPET